jgi:TolB-like protein/class 3 adenylate cyclase/Flp pilus assembly protein TadD
MAADSPANFDLEIAHVLFMDVVGYSKLFTNEQREVLEELNRIVRSTEQFRNAEAAGKLIRLPTGDGMALAFFTNPEAPVKCALEICQKLPRHPGLQLRMGIHSGPVSGVTDVNNQLNIAGAGMNIAQRVMDCGDAGHILLSKRVAEDLSQYSHWRDNLEDLGELEVKHGVKVDLTNLCAGEAGNPALPAKLQALNKAKAVHARQSRFSRTSSLLALVLVLAGVAAVIAYFVLRPHGQEQIRSARPPPKSIAVLPFENLSTEKDNEFFADGLQDDLLTSLAKIQDLVVISRTSVMKYRDTKARNIREIADTLGVANILVGSVRRVAARVAVNVQLVDAFNDRNLWANRYDRTLADSLGIEGELATEIADALRATLTPEEKVRVAKRPTEHADAYDLYLRALPYEQGPDTLFQDYKRAEQLYTQAIALDRNFALAHAHLASTYAEIYHFHEPLLSWAIKAKNAAQTALQLQPDLGEGHFALGQCIYWIDGDYESALAKFNVAQKLLPNDSRVGNLIAAIHRRQGRWPECLAAYERIARVDPQNPNIVRNLVFTNTALRRWPEAARAADRLIQMAPDSVVGKIQRGYVDFCWKGTTNELKSQLMQIPAGIDPDGVVTSSRWEAAMLDHNFPAAQQALSNTALKAIDYLKGVATPVSFLEGCIALASGDASAAAPKFEAAREVFDDAVKEAPDSAERHANLGLACAFLNRKEEAIREGQRAVELKPEVKDATDGALMQAYLALIYARVGEQERALSLIERLLKTPGAVDSANYSMTINDLRHRWEWDPLRNNPRFQKLVR